MVTGLGRTVFQSTAAFCEAERGPKALEPGELWAIRWPQSREPRDRAPRMQPAAAPGAPARFERIDLGPGPSPVSR